MAPGLPLRGQSFLPKQEVILGGQEMANQLKHLILSIGLISYLFLLQPTHLFGEDNSPDSALEGIDAFQAMKIANEWKWSEKEIKSSVYPKTIVFKLPNGRIKNISLPDKKMVVAVAPYINNTHK